MLYPTPQALPRRFNELDSLGMTGLCLTLALLFLTGCAGTGAGSLRYELAEGKTAGSVVPESAFWAENGPPGPEAVRKAAEAGMTLIEMRALSSRRLGEFLAQGTAVLVELDPKGPSAQRYALVLGHETERDLWIIQDHRRPDRLVSGRWLERRWNKSGRRAFIVVPQGSKTAAQGSVTQD